MEEHMSESNKQGNEPDFDCESSEDDEIVLAYLEDPSDVPCPKCGPGNMIVAGYIDPETDVDEEHVLFISPDAEVEYTVVLYCLECERAVSFTLHPEDD